MALPLLPLLIGGGLLGAQNYFANNRASSNSFIDQALRIDRSASDALRLQQQDQALLGGLDVSDPMAIQAAAVQAGDPESFLRQALDLQQAQIRQQQEARAQRQQVISETSTLRGFENTIREDYQDQLQGFAELQQSWTQLRGALESGTPEDALISTQLIMKTLDPTSVVRQEEGQAVITASGPMAGLANELNRIAGEGWNETTRRRWFEAMRRVYAPAAQRAGRQIQQFEDEASRRQLDPRSLSGLGIDREFKALNDPFVSAGERRRAAAEAEARNNLPPGFEIIEEGSNTSGGRFSIPRGR